MDIASTYIIIPSLVFGCVLLISTIMKLLTKFWWTPMRIQRFMRSQGIQGPSYKFIQGNMRDMYTKRMQAIANPMDLSHNILPRVIPHVHSWLNNYGTMPNLFYSYLVLSFWVTLIWLLKECFDVKSTIFVNEILNFVRWYDLKDVNFFFFFLSYDLSSVKFVSQIQRKN